MSLRQFHRHSVPHSTQDDLQSPAEHLRSRVIKFSLIYKHNSSDPYLNEVTNCPGVHIYPSPMLDSINIHVIEKYRIIAQASLLRSQVKLFTVKFLLV